jgi:anti-sigma B factor antagonist
MPSNLSLNGELTIHHASEQHQTLLNALTDHAKEQPFVLNMKDISDVDSAGIQLLIALRKSLIEMGSDLQITHVNAEVASVFATYHLSPVTLQSISRTDSQLGAQIS